MHTVLLEHMTQIPLFEHRIQSKHTIKKYENFK